MAGLIRLNQVIRFGTPQNDFMNTPQKDSLPRIDRLTRPQAIEEIRRIVKALPEDDERCACAIASRYGIFCKGLSRYSDLEFRERFHWIVQRRPGASREELEKLASLYHLGRQEVTGAEVCCDVETREHCGCDGWNTFDNVALEDFYQNLTGRACRIGQASASPS
jgi:hypothetical protein